MSIGFRKLEELIDMKVEEMAELSEKEREILASLCKKIYMLETSQESISTQRLIDTMKGEIANVSDALDGSRS